MRASKHLFAFRQFAVQQEHCAMKVSTDACIQGAYVSLTSEMKSVLDVGAGTGLLSLMLAQRGSWLSIDAIEIDPAAAKQAEENVAASPFRNRIHVLLADARNFDPPQLYDLIVCNPPFFSRDLTNDNLQRSSVRHDTQLTANDLVSLAGRALRPDGALCIMWPERRLSEWKTLMAAARFFLCDELRVRNRIGARASSVITVWRKFCKEPLLSKELIIRKDDETYTETFRLLLKDFYLRL